MKEDTLKTLVGFEMISIHILTFLLLLLLWMNGGFNTNEATTIFGLIVPSFSGYCSAIIAYFVGNRRKRRRSPGAMSWSFSFLAIAAPLVLAIAVWGVLVGQAYGFFEDFDKCKNTLLWIEAALAANIGTIVYAIYKTDPAEKPSPRGEA